MNRLALFDCDGTLVDSQYSIIASMQSAFGICGFPPPDPAAVRSIVGLQLAEAVVRLLPEGTPEGTVTEVVNGYRIAFRDIHGNPQYSDALYEGIPEVLSSLDEKGWLLGVATGKGRAGLDRVLNHFGLRDMFVTLKTADDGPGKPNPRIVFDAIAEAGSSPDACVVIGDTSYDMLMAEKAGAASVGVAWGYHPVETLIRSGARAIAWSTSDVPELAESVLGD